MSTGKFNSAINMIKTSFTTRQGLLDLGRTSAEVGGGFFAESIVHDDDRPALGVRNISIGLPAGVIGAIASEHAYDYVGGLISKLRK
jgi:hypothetical protein